MAVDCVPISQFKASTMEKSPTGADATAEEGVFHNSSSKSERLTPSKSSKTLKVLKTLLLINQVSYNFVEVLLIIK